VSDVLVVVCSILGSQEACKSSKEISAPLLLRLFSGTNPIITQIALHFSCTSHFSRLEKDIILLSRHVARTRQILHET